MAIRATTASISSREIFSPSGYPNAKAIPALVVAIALMPASSKIRALATSHAFDSSRTLGPRCMARKAPALATWIARLDIFRSLRGTRLVWVGHCCPTNFENRRGVPRFSFARSGRLILKAESPSLNSLHELPDAHHRPSHRPPPNLLLIVERRHADGIKLAIEGFHHRLCSDSRAHQA